MRERAQSGPHVAARITGRRTRCAVHEDLYRAGCLGCETAQGWRTLGGDEDDGLVVDLEGPFNGWPLP